MRLHFREHNQVELLVRGAAYFPRLIEAINRAQSEVMLETYIYEDDVTGRAVTDALCAAAQRGARVFVMIDGIGARRFSLEFRRRFLESDVQLLMFRPLKFSWFRPMPHLRRLHRKLAVIDGETAFVGGINVIDDLHVHVEQPLPPRLDYAVEVRGPLVADVLHSMRRLWAYASKRWLMQTLEGWPKEPPPPAPAGTIRAALAIRDNLRRRHLILSAHLAAIYRAKEEIVLAHAYFWPGRRLLRALCGAAARGVRVSVLLQGQPDHPLYYYATQFLYDRLLRSNIAIFEYRKSHLHAKVAVIDGKWATVGSSNIDPFSLLLAREANVVIEDAGFCATLRQSLVEETADGGVEIRKDARRPFFERLRIRLSYEFVRLVATSVGFRV
ncbi:MAG: Cardiolipin synthase [Betaproteobacteria bacterium]|nr:Cardiolipin synthase [Betaproteobacteria bacterium]